MRLKEIASVLALLGSCLLMSDRAEASSDAMALQQRLIEVFEQNKSAVVRVKAAYREDQDSGPDQISLRFGSGFFISHEGHVLVSASRAAGATRVWIEYEGRSYATESVGHDRLTNVSVLRVLDPPETFDIISIDTTVEKPALGSIVIAIACPLEFSPTPSMGIVSGFDNKLGKIFFPTHYIRTSIPIDGGEGGCPMFDLNGCFIGMSISSIAEIKGSFCLPPDALARVRDDLIFSGRIINAWMGFEVTSKETIDGVSSVVLSNLVEGGPAAEGGLEIGDELLAIGNRSIGDVSDVFGATFFTRANQYTTLKVRRGEEVLDFSVKTLPRPERNPVVSESETIEAPQAEAALDVEGAQ